MCLQTLSQTITSNADPAQRACIILSGSMVMHYAFLRRRGSWLRLLLSLDPQPSLKSCQNDATFHMAVWLVCTNRKLTEIMTSANCESRYKSFTAFFRIRALRRPK